MVGLGNSFGVIELPHHLHRAMRQMRQPRQLIDAQSLRLLARGRTNQRDIQPMKNTRIRRRCGRYAYEASVPRYWPCCLVLDDCIVTFLHACRFFLCVPLDGGLLKAASSYRKSVRCRSTGRWIEHQAVKSRINAV